MFKVRDIIYKNKKDGLLLLVLTIFITIMHGVNQTRIHRESAALYWRYLQPYLIQRYVEIEQTLGASDHPLLATIQHTLRYGTVDEAVQRSNDIESGLRHQYAHVNKPISEALQLELDRYNQTITYIKRKEKSLLYQWTHRAIKPQPVYAVSLAQPSVETQ